MTALMSILEANVLAEDSADLESRWREIGDRRPQQMTDGWLLHGLDGGDAWAAIAVWPSEEAFDEYRASVDIPPAVEAFRAANAQPLLATFRIVAEA